MATPLTVSLSINGETAEAISVADGTEPLLYVLRNRFGLHGPKFGCGVAQCGSCTVHVNGAIARSCITRMIQLKNGDEITTLEGLIGTNEAVPGPRNGKSIDLASRKGPGAVLVEAFVEQQAAQCGYCANAMIMGAAGWLNERASSGNTAAPTEQEIKDFLSGVGESSGYVYLCRCGTHSRIIRAIQQAAAAEVIL